MGFDRAWEWLGTTSVAWGVRCGIE
jgi:hypothetical protein